MFPAVLTHICCADNSFTQLLDTMAAMSASSVTFKTAVAPRVVRSRATKLTRATRGSVATQAARDENSRLGGEGPPRPRLRARRHQGPRRGPGDWIQVLLEECRGASLHPPPLARNASNSHPPRVQPRRRITKKNRRRVLTTPASPPHRTVSTARRHGRGGQHPHEPQLPRADPPGVPQHHVQDPDRVRRRQPPGPRRPARPIVEKCGYTQCKVIEGGIDAYLAAYPLTQGRQGEVEDEA